MPTNHVSADKLSVRGKDQGGKHWTAAEVRARKAAADGVKRQGKVSLRVPRWLTPEAKAVWRRVLRQTAGMDLLDNLDSDMLGIYCDAVAKYRQASRYLVIVGDDNEPVAREDQIKMVQAWARLVAAYADKLGFTPAARARLVKRKADEILDEFEEEFG